MTTVSNSPKAKTSGLAIGSLVLGISGLVTCGLGAIAGLVLGIVAYRKIVRSQGQVGGRGLAIAGIIVSGCCILLGLALGLPFLGLIIFFRNDVRGQINDQWQRSRGGAVLAPCVKDSGGAATTATQRDDSEQGKAIRAKQALAASGYPTEAPEEPLGGPPHSSAPSQVGPLPLEKVGSRDIEVDGQVRAIPWCGVVFAD